MMLYIGISAVLGIFFATITLVLGIPISLYVGVAVFVISMLALCLAGINEEYEEYK